MENTTYILSDGTELKSWESWGLYKTERTKISPPRRNEKRISIPGSNGTEELMRLLSPIPTFETRTITDVYALPKKQKHWEDLKSTIYNALNGNNVKIITDRDPWYYWSGIAAVTEVSDERELLKLKISAEVYPYKYERYSSVEDWLWDPFNFEHGVIRDYRGITVSTSKTITIPCMDLPVSPAFWTSDSGMTVTYGTTTVNLTAQPAEQDPKIYTRFTSIILPKGDQDLTIAGSGSVDIWYQGGLL